MFPELIGRYRTFLVVFSVLVFFTNFDQYTEQYGIIPLYWIFATIVLFAPIMLLAVLNQPIHISPIVWWCIGFLVLTSLWYYRSQQAENNYQAVQTRYLSVIFIVLMLFLLADDDNRLLARKLAVVAMLIGASLNIYELFNPMTFSKIAGRSTGLFANANQSGQGVVMAMIVGFGVLPPKWRPVLLIIGIAGVLPTFSRSGMLAWGAAVIALYLCQGLHLREVRRLLIIPIVIIAFAYSPLWGSLEDTLTQRGVLNADVRQRLDFVGSGGEDVQDSSALERQELASLAWERFSMQPVLGWGTGAFYMPPFWLGPHNTYLAMMVDYGLIGIIVYPSLLVVILIGVNRESAKVAVPIVVALLLYGFFSHNLLEQRMTLLGIAIGAATVDSMRKRQPRTALEPLTLQPRMSEIG
ncbi:MAG: O-antigen ligase family protein [Thermomicrobiales bacterium]